MERDGIITRTVTELRRRATKDLSYAERCAVGAELAQTMCRAIATMTEAQLELLRSGITSLESSYLRGLAHSCAEDAVNRRSTDELKMGLTSLLVENVTHDERQTLRKLCLLCHSADLIQVDIAEAFEEIAYVGTTEVATLFRSYFINGSRNPASMGYAVLQNHEGIKYDAIR